MWDDLVASVKTNANAQLAAVEALQGISEHYEKLVADVNNLAKAQGVGTHPVVTDLVNRLRAFTEHLHQNATELAGAIVDGTPHDAPVRPAMNQVPPPVPEQDPANLVSALPVATSVSTPVATPVATPTPSDTSATPVPLAFIPMKETTDPDVDHAADQKG